jgi:hypothetical protein
MKNNKFLCFLLKEEEKRREGEREWVGRGGGRGERNKERKRMGE